MKKIYVILFLAATLISAATAQTKLGQQCGDWYLSIPDKFEFKATNSGGFCFSGVTGVWEEKIVLSRFIQGVYLSPGDSLGIWLELSSPAKKMKISSSLNNGSAVLANRFETMGERVSFPVLTSFLSETLVIEMELPSIYPPAFRPTILSISKIALFYQGAWKRIDLLPDDLNDPGIPVAVDNSPLHKPTCFTLHQNYPNPFNSSTTISFDLSQPGEAILAIYNVSGQLVRTLATGYQSAGSHQVVWDGRDNSGQPVPTGIYLYRLTTGNQITTKKMNLIK